MLIDGSILRDPKSVPDFEGQYIIITGNHQLQ